MLHKCIMFATIGSINRLRCDFRRGAMKLVRIDDYIHGQLKKEAKREGRTLQYLIESKLTKGGGTTISANPSENRVPAEIPTKIFEVNVGLADKGEYPCCKLKKPCKHWQWDGVKEGYVNSLSGRVIEA